MRGDTDYVVVPEGEGGGMRGDTTLHCQSSGVPSACVSLRLNYDCNWAEYGSPVS